MEAVRTTNVIKPGYRFRLVLVLGWMAWGLSVQAGDILRGGAGASQSPSVPRSAQSMTSAEHAAARANARDALARTTRAITAAQSFQQAARDAARASGARNLGADPNHPGQSLPDVPDGLAPGGLEVVPGATAGGTLWRGAQLPVQSGSGSARNVRIEQTHQVAVLNWKTFNVGRNTTLTVDQSAGGSNTSNWIAFNKINDPTARPSQILGKINAAGQVYVLNGNGIIFGATGQINTHTLVASALPINDKLVSGGLLNNPKAEFLFNGLASAASTTSPGSNLPGGKWGDVTVQAGARLSSPVNASKVGGRIALIGANVNNAGTISTPNGQTILAAGLQVGVAAHPGGDPSLRGLDVYVGAVEDAGSGLGAYAGSVQNQGVIEAFGGNAYLTGKSITHRGAIVSSTSVALNGRVDLDASFEAVPNTAYNPTERPADVPFLFQKTGNIELSAGSVIQILPEYGDGSKVAGTSLALRSQINLRGLTTYLGADAAILAPNATVTASAGTWDRLQTASVGTNRFVRSAGQIYLDRGSVINVAGTVDARAYLKDYLLTVQLRGAELAGSPLQRQSIFRNTEGTAPSVTVDLRRFGVHNGFYWVGTPLADLSGYLAIIQRDVSQLTTAGGSVSLRAGDSVVMQPGSKIDVSAGWLNFDGGMVTTSRVMRGGHLVDIADAFPDRRYDTFVPGEFTVHHSRWGVTRAFETPWVSGKYYQAPYVSGADGGKLDIAAAGLALDGGVLGRTVAGPRQIKDSLLPAQSMLAVSVTKEQFLTGIYPVISPTPANVVFGGGAQRAAANFGLDANGNPLALRADRLSQISLSPDLFTSAGFGKLSVASPAARITVPEGVRLEAPAGGGLTLKGANIDFLGSFQSDGGSFSATAFNIPPAEAAANLRDPFALTPPPNAGRGNFRLGPAGVINLSGRSLNERGFSGEGLEPLVTHGGTIAINAFGAVLEKGSLLDVSGGARLSLGVDELGDTELYTAYGDAGSIRVAAGQDASLENVIGGELILQGTLRGYSGSHGGALSLKALTVRIGGGSAQPGALRLAPSFFERGGFASYSVTGIGRPTATSEVVTPGVLVSPGTVIAPRADSYLAVAGRDGGVDFRIVAPPVGVRTPASLALEASGAEGKEGLEIRGGVVLGAGSRIQTDPLASVKLKGQTVAVLGSVYAPGGKIQITGAKDSQTIGFSDITKPLTTVYLGSRSVLSTKGTTVREPDAYDRRIGQVLPGGEISVSGNLVAARGSVLDVSGAADRLDFHPAVLDPGRRFPSGLTSGLTSTLDSLLAERIRVDSDGGHLELSGGRMLFFDGTVHGAAGGPGAIGGSMVVDSGRFYSPGVIPPATDSNLVLTQGGLTIPSALPDNASAIGQGFSTVIGRGYLAADTFQRGRFDSLALNGVVEFSGGVDLDAKGSLRVADGGVIIANQDVHLRASYVALGQPFVPPVLPDQRLGQISFKNLAPAAGTGRLFVEARNIDLGTLSFQGVSYAKLSAHGGDLRGNGIVGMAGEIVLRAAQVYPTTLNEFSVFAYDLGSGPGVVPGKIRIEQAGVRNLPLSAGGRLTLHAGEIEQFGTLRAPMGIINLGWDGTGTAPRDLVAGDAIAVGPTNLLTLGSGSTISVSGVDPLTGRGIVVPFGKSDGTSWFDPRGFDISGGGLPEKAVNIAGRNVTTQAGSVIDLRGGGELYAFQWKIGNGGLVDFLGQAAAPWSPNKAYVSGDLVRYDGATWSARAGSQGVTPNPGVNWTAVPQAYAIVPGYTGDLVPYAPFGDYQDDQIGAGDRITIGGSGALAAGTYTLLPARYAQLPGAVLVTPKTGPVTGSLNLVTGASLASGYQFNQLDRGRQITPITHRYEVAPAEVVRARAEYRDVSANTFLRESAARLNAPAPKLPTDSGYLLVLSSQIMTLQGEVRSASVSGGRGSEIDIAAPQNLVITGDASGSVPNTVLLDANVLSRFGAESLVIGGRRTTSSGVVSLTALTNSIAVENVGAPLTSPDITLVAKGGISVGAGSEISSLGRLRGAESYQLTGSGSLLRVSQDRLTEVLRTGVTVGGAPSLTVGAGATLVGGAVILDSTSALQVDVTALLRGDAFSLGSGRVSVQLDNPGALQPSPGLVLSASFVEGLSRAESLSLLSYSAIDFYGNGLVGGGLRNLALNSGSIRGFNQNGGPVGITADTLTLGNRANATALSAVTPATGTLNLSGSRTVLGAGTLAVNQFQTVSLTAGNGITSTGIGTLSVSGDLNLTTPLLTGEAGSNRTVTATGTLNVDSTGAPATAAGALGATLSLTGQNARIQTTVVLPSGSLSVRSTSGDLTVGGSLLARGASQRFFDVTRFTDAGQISLTADSGNVTLAAGSSVDVSAQSGGGHAGSLTISAPNGSLTTGGGLAGKGGTGGLNGTVALDLLSLPSTKALGLTLAEAHLTQAQAIRVRSGNVAVDGTLTARKIQLSVDQGSITVTGTINASGATGGSISLASRGDLNLENGSLLTVKGDSFDNAGKGGLVTLEAGTQRNGAVGSGSVNLKTGSTIDLSVNSKVAESASLGRYSGKLHLRAPQNAGGTDLQVGAINGTLIGPSSILVEGYRLYDLTAAGGNLTSGVRNTIAGDAQAFLGAAGTTTANYAAVVNRILAQNSGLASVTVLAPGAELINRTGDISLGTASSNSTADWNLSTYRYGPKSAPGVLTLRASGNVNFHNALSDGFTPTLANTDATWLWLARLSPQNSQLPENTQSWSYRITAGADLSAADFHQTQPVSGLAATSGRIRLGKEAGPMVAPGPTSANVTSAVIGSNGSAGGTGLYQVIRTGSGDIELNAGRSVQLLNQFAGIYTAGTQVADPSLGGRFDTFGLTQFGGQSDLGAVQQNYPARFSVAGGNLTITAGTDIERIGASSSRQLPNNWLYRRGAVDPTTGAFTTTGNGSAVASTSWWIDFSNFFQGTGTLGGGNLVLRAGQNITNVDAVVPTNARTTRGTVANPLAANQTLVELGGGDLIVRAGNHIDAGVFYVERGRATLTAGGQITTNATRSPGTFVAATGANTVIPPTSWLPTALFLGKGSFDVSARGDVLLGPVANPFLLPVGLGNSFWNKTYFSTYAADSSVNVSSLGGTLSLRQGAYVNNVFTSLLEAWAQTQQVLGLGTAANAQPWLRLAETNTIPFRTVAGLMPATLRATAFSGGINVTGNLTLSPSPTGNLELLSRNGINGLQPTGFNANENLTAWVSSRFTVSDADPGAIPGVRSPFAYQTLVGSLASQLPGTQTDFLISVDQLFRETGATLGPQASQQAKQVLHAAGLLHAGDAEPVRLYAERLDISGVTLFSPKNTRILAGRDITDVAFYLQNLRSDDVSVIASGRDLTPYNPSSALRVAATSGANFVREGFYQAGYNPLAGDLQIGGPGTLEVLAGRNLDLGSAISSTDGTAAGILSIGNARNPYLPFDGANIVAGAGLGSTPGLAEGGIKWDSFLSTVLGGPAGAGYLRELTLSGQTGPLTLNQIQSLDADERARVALHLFYLVLRDSGRNRNLAGSPTFGTYKDGLAAIDSLFGQGGWDGDIITRERDIRTKSGGDLSLLVPGGGVMLAQAISRDALIPPGVITEAGGDIRIFTDGDVNLGVSRIFTLRGGDIMIWSTNGDIAAGASSKTVQSAPPTRVLIDPTSAVVTTDLAGLATGGGIGVLATVAGVPPGSVDLIAPNGSVDAGDAGIRATGNLNIAAVTVLNSNNISVGGSSSGTPAVVAPTGVSGGGLAAASSAAGASAAAMGEAQKSGQAPNQAAAVEGPPSVVMVEILGYGGGEANEEFGTEEEQERRDQ